MLNFGGATRVYLAVGGTDLRKSFEGLSGLVREKLRADPHSGQLFLFCNSRRTRLKVLFWAGAGCGCARRDTFHTPPIRGFARVLYRYHPFYNKEFKVFGRLGGAKAIYFVRMPNSTGRGIPARMFDEAVCSRIRSGLRPIIECRSLLKLAELLAQQREGRVGGQDEVTNKQGKSGARSSKRSKAAAAGSSGAQTVLAQSA